MEHLNGNHYIVVMDDSMSKRRHTKTATHILPERRHQEYSNKSLQTYIINGDTQLTQRQNGTSAIKKRYDGFKGISGLNLYLFLHTVSVFNMSIYGCNI